VPVVCILVLPLLEFGHGVEGLFNVALGHLDDGSDELLDEAVLQEVGPLIVHKVDDQA